MATRSFKIRSLFRGCAASSVIVIMVCCAPGLSRASERNDTSTKAIRLNTVGYLPQAPKLAAVAANRKLFLIRDVSSGREVLRGELSPLDDKTDEPILLSADFSAVRDNGTYRLIVPGVAESAEFSIGSDIYNWPFYCTVRAMYLWRCGCAVEGEFGGHTFQHRACHVDDAYLDEVGGPAGTRKDGAGGWHDAGDYNKYTVNGAFTAAMMLQAWEHFQDRLVDLNLNIPESKNDTPDFLDEVRWELEWLLKMQTDDGRAYHKISTLAFGGFILPEHEKARRYFSPWSSAATADLAAVTAQAARVYRPFDAEFANLCLAAAKKSYAFLDSHPENHRPDLSAFSTGPYDAPDSDDRLWAAAELWQTTGEEKYLSDVQRHIRSALSEKGRTASIVDVDWDWGNLRNLGLFTYLLSERSGRDGAVLGRLRTDALRAADTIVENANQHKYARTLGDAHYWGCNGTVARQTMNLHVANQLSRKAGYSEAMLHAINHVFGRNPFGRSYVTGLGDQPPMFPHDRRSGGDDIAPPWPGYLVGGPWPKPTDWYDVQEDYKTNETAINWNGALIYALAAFVEPGHFAESISTAKRAARAEAELALGQ
jgi:endoglucanase